MMSSSWRDLTIPPVNARMHSGKFRGRHGCAGDPKLGQEMGKTIGTPLWGILAPQGRQKIQAGRTQLQFPSYKEYRNRTGGISNRGRCVRTGAVPELKSL